MIEPFEFYAYMFAKLDGKRWPSGGIISVRDIQLISEVYKDILNEEKEND